VSSIASWVLAEANSVGEGGYVDGGDFSKGGEEDGDRGCAALLWSRSHKELELLAGARAGAGISKFWLRLMNMNNPLFNIKSVITDSFKAIAGARAGAGAGAETF
jgi:hypothetical protein